MISSKEIKLFFLGFKLGQAYSKDFFLALKAFYVLDPVASTVSILLRFPASYLVYPVMTLISTSPPSISLIAPV